METRADLSTAKGRQYIASMCQHFGRKVPIRNDGATGQIELPFGICQMTASDTTLTLTVTAECQTDLERAAEIIGSHLERFAFRERPDITWHTRLLDTATR